MNMPILLTLALAAAPQGRPVLAPDGATPAEALSLAPDLAQTLLAVPPEESIVLLDWPVAAGVRADVRLTRHEVYAPEARIFVVHASGPVEVPRSSLHFLWGATEDAERSPVILAVDPHAGVLHGYAQGPGDWVELRPSGGPGDEYLVAAAAAFAPPGVTLDARCEQHTLAQSELSPSAGHVESPTAPTAVTALRKATIAVDTDNEFMLLKFLDSTANATSYIASLFALITAAYERDLQVRLLQGTTFLRVSTTPDPYQQSGTGSADSDKLDEFRDYWAANLASVARAETMMLSGKQSNPNSSSGIGFVDALCSKSSGYNFTQVFKFPGSTASNDARIVAHENGHNFGSLHTHCYLDPTPIDMCYNQESGCYSGPTSCPAPMTINGVTNVTGTVMSYCHNLSGCSSKTVFHPRTVEVLAPIINSKVGQCIFSLSGPKEASPADNMKAKHTTGNSVSMTYTPACGATNHTIYSGNLATLHSIGLSWSQRICSIGTTSPFTFNAGSGSSYFVVVGNNGTVEGSYGQGSGGERPPAGPGPGCQYTQDLSVTCP
jgi:hypothetical protein